jgi:hypothetical protein
MCLDGTRQGGLSLRLAINTEKGDDKGAKFWRGREANDRFKGVMLGKNRRKEAKDR